MKILFISLGCDKNLADSEEIAMLIAVGHLPDTLNVPISTRYRAGEIATLNFAPLATGA